MFMASIAPPTESFQIGDAARLSGLTKPMVDYLCRQGILEPSMPQQRGRGRQRRYAFGDVVMLRVLAKLLAAGVSVKRVKNALIALRQHHPEITPTSLPARYLVTDGQFVYLRHNDDTLETLDQNGQMAFMYVLELGRIQAEVIELAKTQVLGGG